VAIDVVICTYDRADDLDRVLVALAAQQGTHGVEWNVLVVDNNSTDGTAEVVQRHVSLGSVPGLRRVLECEQGLTPARRRGVLETSREWVAFVDDDNLLDPRWLASAAAALGGRYDVGALGGRVRLDWEGPTRPYLDGFGFCYAEQEHGPVSKAVDHLNGAGMLLRRSALAACGWLDEPLLADRVGRGLVSGGDVEIAARIRASGYLLWYEPSCVLAHRISTARMSRRYLLRVSAGLGASEAMIGLITWPSGYPAWRRHAWARWRDRAGWAAAQLAAAVRRDTGVTSALAWSAYALGLLRGTVAVLRLDADRRRSLLGVAAAQPPPGR
jgi:glycosyltransferase involved in cell wall biosynthesis